MDFARKQLEKYGWSEGKGLGKHENGISQALKPKIKRSVTGVGHDPASEFNEHWWSALYDKAAGNVEVEENNGKTKKIKTKADLNITTNTWQISKGAIEATKEQYSEFFVRTSILTKGGNRVEKVRESESDEELEMEKPDVLKMTDEELFAACGGRTGHKGARHGLKATGKLARIAQQEAMLLSQSKYNGYSHAKEFKKPIEDTKLGPDDNIDCKKKKKKRKSCFNNQNFCVENSEVTNNTSTVNNEDNGRKEKSRKNTIDVSDEYNAILVKPKNKKKRQIHEEETTIKINEVEIKKEVRKKKKKS